MRIVSTIIVVMLLSGCAAWGPPIGDTLAADPTNICMNRLQSDPAVVGALGEKMGIGRAVYPTQRMLEDKRFPTDDDKRAMTAYSNARGICITSGIEYRQKNMPQIAGLLAAGSQSGSELLDELQAGGMTYGEFNQRRAQLLVDAGGGIDRSEQQRAAIKASQLRAISNTLGVVGAGMQSSAEAQARQAEALRQNRPVRTNCTRTLNTMDCTSY